MTKKAKQDIIDAIESEGLDYALQEYSDIFYAAKDTKLSKLVEQYIEIYNEIEDYLDLDEDYQDGE